MLTSDGRVYNPFGSAFYASGWFNQERLLEVYQAATAWRAANPKRYAIVTKALLQNLYGLDGHLSDQGWCNGIAKAKYLCEDSSAWCTEFAREMFKGNINAGACWCETDSIFGCLDNVCPEDTTAVSDFKGIFGSHGGWVDRDHIWLSTAQPGDYLTMVGSQGQHKEHSAVIVGVSHDYNTVYTEEGNVLIGNDHCVHFMSRPYFIGATLDSNLDAIGKINSIF